MRSGGLAIYPGSHRRMHHTFENAYAVTPTPAHAELRTQLQQQQKPFVFEGHAGDVILCVLPLLPLLLLDLPLSSFSSFSSSSCSPSSSSSSSSCELLTYGRTSSSGVSYCIRTAIITACFTQPHKISAPRYAWYALAPAALARASTVTNTNTISCQLSCVMRTR